MLRLLALIFWLAPAAFVASPLTADDLYDAPDPGWYQQGSGYRPDARTDQPGYGDDGGSGYHYDDFRGGADDSSADRSYGWSRGGYDASTYGQRNYDQPNVDQPSYDQPSYHQPDSQRYAAPRRQGDDARWRRREAAEPAPERRSPNGYGAPDWAQEPLPQEKGRAGYANGQPDDGVFEQQPWEPERGRYRDESQVWRAPPARPKYRFREDPALEQAAGDRRLGDHRFRPLTSKEQERHRDADRDPRFAEPHPQGRYRSPEREPRRREGERGTAFGYAPVPGQGPPDDFYRRYYRSGP